MFQAENLNSQCAASSSSQNFMYSFGPIKDSNSDGLLGFTLIIHPPSYGLELIFVNKICHKKGMKQNSALLVEKKAAKDTN